MSEGARIYLLEINTTAMADYKVEPEMLVVAVA
jgi:hypothetical protein